MFPGGGDHIALFEAHRVEKILVGRFARHRIGAKPEFQLSSVALGPYDVAHVVDIPLSAEDLYLFLWNVETCADGSEADTPRPSSRRIAARTSHQIVMLGHQLY